MGDDKTEDGSGKGLVRRLRQPLFEKDLLTAGSNILESMTVAVFRDQQELIDACRYFGHLELFDMDEEIRVALYKLNGTMAIEGRARDDAVQAHAHLFFPRHLSKEERRSLEHIQYRSRKDGDKEEEEERATK